MSESRLEITPSRIQPPTMPANFLSRSHLFNLFEDPKTGYTVVVAPAGYGKTTLLAEWAKQSERKVIWYTMSEMDSLDGISVYFVSAIEKVFPNFSSVTKPNSVREAFKALGELKERVVLVLDNVVDSFTYQLNVTQSYMDEIPDNVHIIAIRRLMPTVSLQRFANAGRLSIVTAGDLKFSKEEIERLLIINGKKESPSKIDEITSQTHGWPAAVALIATGVENDLTLEVDDEYIRNLVLIKFNKLSFDIKEGLLKLSSFEIFDMELVNHLTDGKVTQSALNRLAAEGVFILNAAGQSDSYLFCNSARECINEVARQNIEKYQSNQIKASEYFNSKNMIDKSIVCAIDSGNSEYLRKMFKPALRKLISQGDGRKVLNWCKSLPVDSERNKIFAKITRIMGHLANFEFEVAQQLSEELRFTFKSSPITDFIHLTTSIALVHIAFCKGRLFDFDSNMNVILNSSNQQLGLENTEMLVMLRLFAAREFLFDNSDKLNDIESRAIELAKVSQDTDDLFNLQTISSMKLFLDGEYIRAFEAASLAIEMGERNKYFGVTASCEPHYIKARCLLEFAEAEKANSVFEELAQKAREWQQWPWVLMAESYLSRNLIITGKVEEAFEIVRSHRKLVLDFKGEDILSNIIDQNELFLRFWMRDYERAGQILNRLPTDLYFAKRYRVALKSVLNNEKYVRDLPQVLPSDSARDRIWKLIVECSAKIDQESLATESLSKALEIGAKVGAKETFLRQDIKILELIIRLSSLRPTVYIEDLARHAIMRMNSKNHQSRTLNEPLTKREIEVLRSLASGNPITEIGRNLHISHNTMKTHLRNIYRKLDANGREQALIKAKSLFII